MDSGKPGVDYCGCDTPDKTLKFRVEIDTTGLQVDPLELEVYGRGRTYAECLGDAILHWGRTNAHLAERFDEHTVVKLVQ